MLHQIFIYIHLLGFGLLMTSVVAGLLLNLQYRRASDYKTKAALLKSSRPIGILSPLAVLIMLITGIGNMHTLGIGLFSLAWLAYKIVFFAFIAVAGVLFAIVSRKRSTFVLKLSEGIVPPDAQQTLKGYDRQVSLFYLVMALCLLIIIALTVYGTRGG